MSRFIASRRGFLVGSTFLAASVAWPKWAQAQDSAEKGGRLVVAADSEPRNLNPAIVASNGVFFVASKIVEPLAEASFDGENGLSPRLATAWEGSADGLTVTFRLREGVTWHDGTPFTAADVAFSALEVWKPLQNLGRVVFKALDKVETPDDHTAVFHFSEPTPFQLVRNALPALTAVLPKHVFAGTDIAANPANEKLIGTGPFKYAEHKTGEYYRLVRNDAYWGEGEPHLDEIIYRVLPDRAAAAGALEAEEIDLAAFSAVPLADLDRISKVPGLAVISKGYEALTYQLVVEINHRRKELADLKVRQAIAHAIDRDFVVKTIFLGYAKTSTGPVPRYDNQFYTRDVPSYPFDVAKANELLDEAGYKRGGGGTRFALKLLPAPYFNETRQFGDYLRQALAAIGIDARIVNNDAAAHQKAVYTDHDFDLAIAPTVYRGDPAISTTILVESGIPAGVPFSNQGGYTNAELDALIAAAAREIDETKRTALYHEFQQKVEADLPLINVAEWGFITVANERVKNISNNPRWAVSNWADTWVEPR
ncbi:MULTISPECIES: ABC transporter substrate-binding protein [Brucella/Ochrobactrum group]|uniref:Oligopeptide ABC transporter, periplasmic oligopeptide-binding protein OppA (TC 3.A.1.5.1) n=1 Tax=Ochrobactrum soli TaxID=2448455 RepID=A0A2P9HG02_9HYPH|nr:MULTISPECIES: ABC transporter substrate-binding protein [Brucella]MCI1002138.1 ABC transporter substrate-binding protein [Ochrobactrum sp. C6C9]RRD22758.1 ABC transporter substrate-binding protein [Brucellaceae bacterium VT-16-1752]MDX4076028.1 ABC transporter substrate-binding protein [Brucella sp. NBRC 113783]RLL71624.1 ABC transporter substrate-binding protein [[Ochrobactrum] soli]SPL62999.1 Oligopeptide ABC transporter, periplasmic oligopeptide-binding protein OppA (TC 3.A.1.5.1) [[Ochr